MKHKPALFLIAALLLITAVTAFLHLSSRTVVLQGEVLICTDGRQQTVSFGNLTTSGVEGEIVNAKGDRFPISGSGVPLSDVLKIAGIDPQEMTAVTVIASDEYRAELTGSEICQPDKAWLLFQEDGGLRLIVFGDPDSRRNVSNVVRMEAK